MLNVRSSGGVVVHNGKFLLLYKKSGQHDAWVLPKGRCEEGESSRDTALREVMEETSVGAEILDFIGKTHYIFKENDKSIYKEVEWYLMKSESFYSRPQREEGFFYSGYYKYFEAYHLLKYNNEKQILEKASKIFETHKK